MSAIEYKYFIPALLPGRNEQEKASRTNKYAGAAMKKKYTKLCELFSLNGAGVSPSGTERVWLLVRWLEPNKKRDPDNVSAGIKYILDGLVLSGILKNDGFNQIAGFIHKFEINKTNPGVIVSIMQFEADEQ